MALQAQDDKKREERENFLITTIPITMQAAHEPSLYHTTGEEHAEDGMIFRFELYNIMIIYYDIFYIFYSPESNSHV